MWIGIYFGILTRGYSNGCFIMNRVEVTCDNCKEEYDFIDESKLESYYFYCPNCGEESEIDNATPSSTVER